MKKEEKRELKQKIKKDKARLKELKQLEKQRELSEEETWEYAQLSYEQAGRDWDTATKCNIVFLVIISLSAIIGFVGFVLSMI